jgi:EmrB/QacA subfamily drug resistance transporter
MAVATALFMQFLDATALNTAIPAIARDFRVPAIDLNAAILAYTLSLAAFIPVGGALADRIGARNAFAVGLSVFMAGSLMCAASRSLPLLVAARALQGVGGSVMTPVARQLVVRTASKSELISAMNWLLVPGIMGPLLGPVVGGALVTYASWRWIFLVNVPVALLGVAITFAVIPDFRDAEKKAFDAAGALIVGLALFGLVFGLERAAHPRTGWLALPPLALGVALALVYLRHARRTLTPVIDLSLLSIASFRQSMISGSFIRVITGATGFLLPLWFQLGMGMTAAKAGALTVATSVGALLSRFVGGWLLRAAHPRRIAIAGAAALVATLGSLSLLRPEWPPAAFYAVLLPQGLAVGVSLLIIGPVAYVDVEAPRIGAATCFYTVVQQLTLSVGVTMAVWSMRAIERLSGSSDHDGRTYAGSLLLFAGLAVVAVHATRRIDGQATEALRPETSQAVMPRR